MAAACAREAGFGLCALSIDYGQRHRVELDAARRVAAALGARQHRVVRVDLRAIGGSALTADIEVPKNNEPDARARAQSPERERRVRGRDARATIPVTYVPARNLLFLAIAAGYAEVAGAGDLYIGVNAVDYSGYPDCRPEFISSLEKTVNLGTRAGAQGRPLRISAPLAGLSKADIIRLGSRLGVDFSLTHSCYDPDARGRACGRCESCAIRRRGFAGAGMPDPAAALRDEPRRMPD